MRLGILRRRVTTLLAGFLLMVVAGCSDGRPPLYPTQGQVLYNGKPTPGAVVWLHPMEDGSEPNKKKIHPYGVVDSDGEFQIGTYEPYDGAPAGKYRVSFSWSKPSKGGDEEGELLLPPRYMNPNESGFQVEVLPDEGGNVLPKMELKD